MTVQQPAVSAEQLAKRQRAVASARGSLAIEGLVPPADVERLMAEYAAGRLSLADVRVELDRQEAARRAVSHKAA